LLFIPVLNFVLHYGPWSFKVNNLAPGAPPPPSSSSAAPQRRCKPLCRATQGLPLPLLTSTRRPRARPPPHFLPAGLPRARHTAARATSSCLPSPPVLTAAAALPAPFSTLLAHTRRLQPAATLASLCRLSSARDTPPRLSPSSARPPRRATGRQQQLLLTVPSPELEACPRTPLDFFYPFTRPLLPSSSSAQLLAQDLRRPTEPPPHRHRGQHPSSL
jgi:hypothetical protein